MSPLRQVSEPLTSMLAAVRGLMMTPVFQVFLREAGMEDGGAISAALPGGDDQYRDVRL